MADLSDIRSGLAALLRTALPEGQGHVDDYYGDGSKLPCLQVAGVDADGMEELDFALDPTRRWTIVVEALASLVGDRGAQKLLDTMLDLVPAAVESDNGPSGALFSRLVDNVAVAGDTPAAQSVAYDSYRGQVVRSFENGTKALVYSFAVQVIS